MRLVTNDTDINQYEIMLSIGERKQVDALSQAEASLSEITADELAFELSDCAEELLAALKKRDAGEVDIRCVGLVLLNVRKAMAQRQSGVFAAPDAAGAIDMALRGEAL